MFLKVSEDPLDLKGSWDLRETQETPDLQDPRDYKVRKIFSKNSEIIANIKQGSPDCPD